MFRKRFPARLLALVGYSALIISPPLFGTESPTYIGIDFEPTSGWAPGALPPGGSMLRLLQGKASVIEQAEEGSKQMLEIAPSDPFGAVYVDLGPFAQERVLFCEVLAQPFAVSEDADYEFFEVGGAVLGFFRTGNRGEVRALYAREGRGSVWISTGVQFELNEEGLAKEWLHLAIVLERSTGRWDLAINGVARLSGLHGVVTLPELPFPLWMYGDADHPCRFDDLLISAVPRAELTRDLALAADERLRQISRSAGIAAPKKVTQAKQEENLRQRSPALRKIAGPAPKLRGIDATLQIGDQTYHTGAEFEMNGHPTKLLITRPGERGGILTITADAQLEPGVDISRIRWRILKMGGGSGASGETVMQGTFETGLMQTCTIPPELETSDWRLRVDVVPERFELRLQLPPWRLLDPNVIWER
jgi:hypothetical protein